MIWLIIVGIALVLLFVWGLRTSKDALVPNQLLRYDGYETHTTLDFKNGKDSYVTYDATTGRITYKPGTPDTIKEITTGYTTTYTAPGGQQHTFHYKPERFSKPEFEVGTIVLFLHQGIIPVEDQEKAKIDFENEKNRIVDENRKTYFLTKQKRNTPFMRILSKSSIFVGFLLLVIFATNLSIVMPQFTNWLTTTIKNFISDTVSNYSILVLIITYILSIFALLLSYLLYYLFTYGNILVVPLVTIFMLKDEPFFAPFFKRLSIILIGIVISFATGNALESKLNNIGLTLTNIPYFGSLSKNVIYCALIAILILSIVFFFIHLDYKACEKHLAKREKELNEHLGRYRNK